MLKAKAEQLTMKTSTKKWKKTSEDQFSRVQLVLSVKQLIAGNFPCPKLNPFSNFKQLKTSYKPVTSTSRILALDVETVRFDRKEI